MKQEMTKSEAIKAMERGEKVAHRFFAPDEWVATHKVGSQTYRTEEGYNISASEFWAFRTGEDFETGWRVWEPPQEEMMKGEGFTPGEWEITETESGSMSIAEKSDHSIICVLAEWRKERKANARLICQAPAMYAALNEVGPLLDGLINRTPSGYKRNELCDLNIKVKTILNQINNH